jgi:hypothetical protein
MFNRYVVSNSFDEFSNASIVTAKLFITRVERLHLSGTLAVLRGTNSTTPLIFLLFFFFLQSSKLNQQSQQGLAANKVFSQPSISITPLPRQTPIPQQGSTSNNTVINSTGLGKAGKQPPSAAVVAAGAANNKNSFVVCEICDGYIKVSTSFTFMPEQGNGSHITYLCCLLNALKIVDSCGRFFFFYLGDKFRNPPPVN